MDLSSLYKNTSSTQAKNSKISASPANFLHSQYYVEGCLLGACACPEIPLPDVWLPWVIKTHGQIKNVQQADQITDRLFAFLKHTLSRMHNDEIKLPDYAVYNENDYYALSQWCKGIVFAHFARESYWQEAWDRMQVKTPELAPLMAKDLKHCLLMFSTFADPEKAIEQAKAKGDNKLSEKLAIISKSLASVLVKYVAISGELASFLPNQFETFVDTQDNSKNQ